MRDFLAGILERLQATTRQQRLYILLGVIVALLGLRYGTAWFMEYRDGVKADIGLHAQRLASAKKLLETAPQTQQRLEALRERYRQTVKGLVPGDTPTLAAAQLQDRVSDLAAKNGARIQTTQVLNDEAVGSFRKVSLRVTATGEIRNLAGLLSDLEFGSLRVTIPFVELTRRGGARRRNKRSNRTRAVSATFQISSVLAASATGGANDVLAQEVSANPDAGASPALAKPAPESKAAQGAPPKAKASPQAKPVSAPVPGSGGSGAGGARPTAVPAGLGGPVKQPAARGVVAKPSTKPAAKPIARESEKKPVPPGDSASSAPAKLVPGAEKAEAQGGGAGLAGVVGVDAVGALAPEPEPVSPGGREGAPEIMATAQ